MGFLSQFLVIVSLILGGMVCGFALLGRIIFGLASSHGGDALEKFWVVFFSRAVFSIGVMIILAPVFLGFTRITSLT